MPELPEVETIRLQLSKVLIGKTVKDIGVRKPKMFRGDKKFILGKKIIKIRRYSKLLVFDFNDSYSLAVHLRMTGRLVFEKADGKIVKEKINWEINYESDKHTHIIIYFTDKSKLYFNDLRQFGFMQVLLTSKVEDIPYVKTLGPEFFRNLDETKFIELVKKGTRPIKLLLIDQQKVAGIGNIYANESLWCAKINPKIKANQLAKNKVTELFNCLEKVMRQAIVWGGASDNDYRDAFGQKGEVQEHFEVYNREGEPCHRCKTPVTKISLGGRGTYFCPACQR